MRFSFVMIALLAQGCSGKKKPSEELPDQVLEPTVTQAAAVEPSTYDKGPVAFCGQEYEQDETEVLCEDYPISDLTPLAGLTALEELYLRDTQVTDLSPLAGLTRLQDLKLSNTQVRDLAPLKHLTVLVGLDISGTQVTDLSPLASLTSLEWLDLRKTQVTELKSLENLTALERVWISGTKLSNTQVEKLQAKLPSLMILR